jgi:hypothetical protein
MVLFAASCKNENTADQINKLPELPDEILATLDQKTLSTAISNPGSEPVLDPGVVLAPCCNIEIRRSLQVNFPYTKCGPLVNRLELDEIFAGIYLDRNPGSDRDTTLQQNFKLYKYSQRVDLNPTI